MSARLLISPFSESEAIKFNKSEEINVKGGFLNYGNVKNQYILIKGSIGGTQKRLIRLTDSIRPKKNVPESPQIVYTSLESKQGR